MIDTKIMEIAMHFLSESSIALRYLTKGRGPGGGGKDPAPGCAIFYTGPPTASKTRKRSIDLTLRKLSYLLAKCILLDHGDHCYLYFLE
jgi:hypothetical protein